MIENKKLIKQLDKYAVKKIFHKGLHPYFNVYDKFGALLYQYDLNNDYLYMYVSIEEYKCCLYAKSF